MLAILHRAVYGVCKMKNENYSVTRRGTDIIVTGPKGSKVLNGCSSPEEIPSIYRKLIRKAGMNPDDFFWFSGYAVRKTHQDITVALAAECRAEYESSPKGLRARRDSIVDRIMGAHDAAASKRNRNWERGDESGGALKNEYDRKAAAAQEELREFDARYPEIKAAIAQEQAEAAERFERTN